MPVSDDALLDALELSPFLDAEVPGRLTRLRLPGVLGRVSDLSHPFANLVGAATLDEASAPATIATVCRHFASRGHAFGWLVGPKSTPSTLRAHLIGAGFSLADELAGLVRRDLHRPVPTNPAVRIREATPEDIPAANRVLERADALPEAVADLLNQALFLTGGPGRPRAYLAYIEGDPEPAGFASWTPIPGQPIIVLDGAATVVPHQRKGVYTSLVARRLADGRAYGAEAAVIQAVRGTSAPICERLGFTELGAFELFAWHRGPPPEVWGGSRPSRRT